MARGWSSKERLAGCYQKAGKKALLVRTTKIKFLRNVFVTTVHRPYTECLRHYVVITHKGTNKTSSLSKREGKGTPEFLEGDAGEADGLSQREPGQCAGHTAVMDRLGSGAVDRVAECEWWSQSSGCPSNEGTTLRGDLSHYCHSNCHPLECSGSLQIPEQFIPHFCWKKNEKSYTGRNK